jgi:phage FluMu gp28-like protein
MTAAAPNALTDAIQGVLLGYQQRWIADESPLKIAEKSRRTGLTWAEAADAVLCAALAKSEGGTNHFYVGSGKDMAIEFIEACAMWAKAFDKACSEIEEEVLEDEDKDILTFVIRFSSGFKIQALSSRPSNMRGRQGNVTLDEAAFHDNFAEVLKAALALTMWGAKVRIISTHNGVDNEFNLVLEDSRAGRKDYSVHRITLDDACADGLYRRICERNGREWSQEAEDKWKAGLLRNTATKEDAMEEYYCVPKQGGGVYISRSLIEARMFDAPVIRYTGSDEFNAWPEHLRHAEIEDWCKATLLPLLEALNKDEQHCFGEDFARSGDLTVFAPMAITQRLQRVVPFLVELRNVPFKQQEQILFYILDRLPRFLAGKFDARGNGQYLAEVAVERYGERIEAVMLSNAWYLAHMPKFKAAFEDGHMSVPRDAGVLDDLRAIQSIKGIPKIPDGDTSKGQGGQRHGDAAVALCMAYAASLCEAILYEFESFSRAQLNRDRDNDDDIRTNFGFGRQRGGAL